MVAPSTANTHRNGSQRAGEQSQPKEAAKSASPPWLPELEQLSTYFAYFMSTQADLVRLRIRQWFFSLALFIAAAFMGAMLLIGATIYLLKGCVDALAAAFGGRAWPAELIVGGGMLLLAGLLLAIGSRRIAFYSRKRLVQKYDQQHRQQRAACGRDVQERAQF